MNDNCKYKGLLLNSNEDLKELIDKSYNCFFDCMNDNTYFMGKKVLYKREKDLNFMKELGYLHIVTMENESKIRIFEKNRMIYVPFIKNILTDCCSEKKCNEIAIYKDNKDICIWCRKIKYLIVLSPRNNGILLKTAYPVIYDRKIHTIEKKINENDLLK